MTKSSITLDNLLQRFLASKLRSPDTVRSYNYVIKTFKKRTGVCCVDEIHYDLLIQWRDDLLKTATTTTFNTYLRQMRAIFNFALLHELASINEFKKISFAHIPQAFKKVTSDAGIQNAITQIFANAEKFEPAWFYVAVIQMLRQTGIRRRQLIGIRWSDIAIQDECIILQSAFAKSKKINIIPLAPVADIITLLRQKTNEMVSKQYNGQVFNWALFNPRLKTKEMTVDQVSHLFKRINSELELTEVLSPHRMRHAFGTAAAQYGDLVTLKQLLGHSDIRITAQYVHPDLKRMRKMMQKAQLKTKKHK